MMDNDVSPKLRIPPPAVFFVFGGLMWFLSAVVPQAAFVLPAKTPVALAVAAVGGLFAGASIRSFLRAGTTMHPGRPAAATRLVVTGVNAVSRNPMYLSLLLVLVGWAIYLANLAALVPIPFFVITMNRFQVLPEERALAARFGSEFEAYCKRVRRWL